MKNHLILATTNAAKTAKLRWLLAGLGIECVIPERSIAVAEEGKAHLENAEAKALAWSKASGGEAAIATDGGLVIPALGERWDALVTARFAGPAATDRERLDRLLALMRPYHGGDRQAYWREAIAVAEGGSIVGAWSAESSPGTLAESYDVAKLVPGFWAFTIWRIPEFGKAYGELTAEEIEHLKDHWGRLRAEVRAWFLASHG